MKNAVITLNLPERADYLETHGNLWGATLNTVEGGGLFDIISSTDGAIRCICATGYLQPALAGISVVADDLFKSHDFKWTDRFKQFAGTVAAVVMEANGFENAGNQKPDPNGIFSKAETFCLKYPNKWPW